MNNQSDSDPSANHDAPTPANPSKPLNLLVTATMQEGQTFEEFKDNIIRAMVERGILKPDGSSSSEADVGCQPKTQHSRNSKHKVEHISE